MKINLTKCGLDYYSDTGNRIICNSAVSELFKLRELPAKICVEYSLIPIEGGISVEIIHIPKSIMKYRCLNSDRYLWRRARALIDELNPQGNNFNIYLKLERTMITEVKLGEVDLIVDYIYHKPYRGARDTLAGVPNAGPPLEPDEPAEIEIIKVETLNGNRYVTSPEEDEQIKDQIMDTL